MRRSLALQAVVVHGRNVNIKPLYSNNRSHILLAVCWLERFSRI